jgi:hypothetical protein
MRRLLWVYVLIVPLLVASLQASAQYGSEAGSKFALHAGAFRPSGELLRDKGSSIWKSFGLNYNITFDKLDRPEKFVSFDYASKDGGGFSGHSASVSYNQLWRSQTRTDEVKGPYWGGGAGLYMVDAKADPNVYLFPPYFGQDESGMKLGLSIVGGYDLNENWYAEARYTKMGQLADDIDFSGLTIYVGTRRLF